MSIEEIKNLVKQEKESEEKLRKTREEAASLIERSKENALKILQEAEDQKHYDAIYEARLKEIEEKKKMMESKINEKIERIREIANKNLEKTISLIVKYVLEE